MGDMVHHCLIGEIIWRDDWQDLDDLVSQIGYTILYT